LSGLEILMNAAKGVDKMYHIQHAYAGIGSRQITSEEASILRGLGARLASLGFWLYSGNATGADQAFEEGADDRAVLFLPWDDYNPSIGANAVRCTQITEPAMRLAQQLHPKGKKLSSRSALLMARNVQIVDGIAGYPPVDFVLCCADPLDDGVAGGAMMAYRVAKLRGIPFINVRREGLNRPGFGGELLI
jgi:hypothetical protein